MFPALYRKRFIPNEKVHLKDDQIIELTSDRLITKWKSLKPRQDIAYGVSCVFFDKNIKVSKIFNANDELVYYYCDIIKVEHNENEIITTDLLVDVLVMPNADVKVLDLHEVPDAFDKNLIDVDTMKNVFLYLDNLLNIIYDGKFFDLVKCLEGR